MCSQSRSFATLTVQRPPLNETSHVRLVNLPSAFVHTHMYIGCVSVLFLLCVCARARVQASKRLLMQIHFYALKIHSARLGSAQLRLSQKYTIPMERSKHACFFGISFWGGGGRKEK